MNRYDANPALSAFAVTLGAVLGIVVAVILDFGFTGTILLLVMGIALAGLVTSALGLVGPKDRGDRSNDDLPSHYHDY